MSKVTLAHARTALSVVLLTTAGPCAGLAAAQDITNPGDPIVGSSINVPAAEGVANVIDNNAGAKYLNFDELNTGFTVTPSGSGVVRALTLITANDAPQRDPASYTLEGSDDGVNFSLIASGPLALSTNRFAITQVPIANSTAYVHYRVLFPTVRNAATANSMQIGEVQLNTNVSVLSPGDGVTATYTPGAMPGTPAEGPASLVDGAIGAKFNVTGGNLGPTIVVITPAAGSTIINGVDVFSANDDLAFPNRTPQSLTIEGSNDGTNYTQIFTTPLAAMNGNYLDQQYGFANAQSYTRYRVTLGASIDGSMQLGELRLMGSVGVSPPSNDACATPITVTAGVNPGTSVNATGASLSSCGTGDTNDVWFRFVATASGTVQADTCGPGTLDTTLAVYTTCAGLPIACNDHACGAKSRVRWIAASGSAYLIRVAGNGGATGGFTLTITENPVVHNDVIVPLAFNFNGVVHLGEDNNPDNPDGFRSLSDRAFRLTGAPGSMEVGLEGPTGIPYRVETRAVGSSRVDLQACKLEYSIVSPK